MALLVFALGSGVSVYGGIRHIARPEPISGPLLSYIVLAVAFLFEGASWLVSFRQFGRARGELGFYEAFRRSKDPPSIVLFEDSAALAGILVAAAGTFLAVRLHAPVFDGIASVVIGLILGGTAALLARESKSLLIGERVDPNLATAILRLAGETAGVSQANGLITVQLAPDQVLAALSLDFENGLGAREIEQLVAGSRRACEPSIRRRGRTVREASKRGAVSRTGAPAIW